MQPLIHNAQRVASFAIGDDLTATLLTQVEAAGMVQYRHILVVFGDADDPVMFTASEWNPMIPETQAAPYFGVFHNGQHQSLNTSADWQDLALFTLHSTEFVAQHMGIDRAELLDGEAWALDQMMQLMSEGEQPQHHPAYRDAVRRYRPKIEAHTAAMAAMQSEQAQPSSTPPQP